MKKIIYILFSLLTVVGCSQDFNSTELNNNFTEAEIRDLNRFTDFFQDQMCGNNKDFKGFIDSLIPYLREFGWQPVLQNIDFNKQKSLYNSFESNVFNEIWDICKSRNLKEEWERKSLCLNPKGKFIKFLEELGKRNGVLEAYKNALLEARDFIDIQRIESEIYNKSKRIDLNDPGIKVLIAIDYLTQNDQQKRNEPWPEN